MQIELNGQDFDVDPEGHLDYYHLAGKFKTVEEARDTQVYLWLCKPPGRGQFAPPATTKGKVPLRPIVVFAERDAKGFAMDPKATRAMQRRYLAKTSATTLSDLTTAVNRKLRVPMIDIPVATWAWMNPLVSYVVALSIDFTVMRLSAAKPDLKFYIMMPHRARFTAEVLDYCKPEEMAEREASGGNPDEEVEVIYEGGSRYNTDWRRAGLRFDIERSWMTLYGLPEEEQARRRAKLLAELDALSD